MTITTPPLLVMFGIAFVVIVTGFMGYVFFVILGMMFMDSGPGELLISLRWVAAGVTGVCGFFLGVALL